MRILKDKILLLGRTLEKKEETYYWSEITFDTLKKSKGKTFLIPIDIKKTKDIFYYEILEVVTVNKEKVYVKLYNYNEFYKMALENEITIEKVGEELEAISKENYNVSKLTELENTPIPFCNLVSAKMKLGRVECLKKTYFENLNYAKGTDNFDGTITISQYDVSDRKNHKKLFEIKEKFKKSNRKNLFKHLFAKMNSKKVKKN